MHPLGYYGQPDHERCGEGFIKEGLSEAQRRSWEALHAIAALIRPGMTEREASRVCDEILREKGSPRSWHRSIVRFGSQTTLTYGIKGDMERRLAVGEPFFLDLGPNWVLPEFGGLEYEGDVGDTFVAGDANAEQLSLREALRTLHREASVHWAETKPTGKALYDWLSPRASRAGFELLLEAHGHRLGDFPHSRFSKAGMVDLEFSPASHLWVLEVHLVHPLRHFGGFFEDILAVPVA